jgi:hypothetical protein
MKIERDNNTLNESYITAIFNQFRIKDIVEWSV